MDVRNEITPTGIFNIKKYTHIFVSETYLKLFNLLTQIYFAIFSYDETSILPFSRIK
jgi:hypothetical protein